MKATSTKLGWHSLPIGAVILTPGSSVENKTGDWRTRRPVLDEPKCTNCLLCWIYCPEPAIERGEKVVRINYDFCKGCGICASECPLKAISMVEGA